MQLGDTNILSELARPEPNAGVLAWASGVRRLAVSVVSLEEIAFGLAWRPNDRVRAWLDGFFEARCDLFPVTGAVAERSGHIRGSLRGRGVVMSQADGLIAATAQVHGATLVTRNTADFAQCQIPLLNPFT